MPRQRPENQPGAERTASRNGKNAMGGEGTHLDKKAKVLENQTIGQAMVVRKITQSLTQTQLSTLFACGPATVKKRLEGAISADLQEMTRDVITERLIPKAVGVLEAELDKGNYSAAKDLLSGLQVFKSGGNSTVTHVTSNSPTLDAIRKEHARAIEAEIITTTEEPVSASEPTLQPDRDEG